MMELPINKVLHGDCLELMKTLPQASVDAVITDPPYGITECKWDIIPDLTALWNEWLRVLKPQGIIVVFCNFMLGVKLVNTCPRANFLRYDLVWQKTNAVGFFNANRMPLRTHENILIFGSTGTARTYNPQMTEGTAYTRIGGDTIKYITEKRQAVRTTTVNNGYRYPVSVIKSASAKKGVHPTEKPQQVLEWLIRTYTNENDVVLDSFAGSGSAALACITTHRNYILMEKEEKFVKVINERIANFTGNFSVAAGNYNQNRMLYG